MTTSRLETDLYEQIGPVVDGLGYALVELKAQEITGAVQVSLVIFSRDGVGIDDCVRVHETVQPRAEIVCDRRDVRMEVSSPGTRRVLKGTHEYSIFTGERVRVLTDDRSDWISGRIGTVRDDGFSLDQDGQELDIPFTRIKKARLDDSQEVK